MDFEQAVILADEIASHPGWTASIIAGGSGDEAYLNVSARFERFGLVYEAEIEMVPDWPQHFQRVDRWCKAHGHLK